jgi:hypothetical protein
MQRINLADGFGTQHNERAVQLVGDRLEQILRDASVEGFVTLRPGDGWYVSCPVEADLQKAMAAFTARLALTCVTPT